MLLYCVVMIIRCIRDESCVSHAPLAPGGKVLAEPTSPFGTQLPAVTILDPSLEIKPTFVVKTAAVKADRRLWDVLHLPASPLSQPAGIPMHHAHADVVRAGVQLVMIS